MIQENLAGNWEPGLNDPKYYILNYYVTCYFNKHS